MQEFDYEKLRKATQDFSKTQVIGKGSHGCVYKGMLQDGQVVAIKRCSIGLQNLQDNICKLENEVCILSSLPNTNHVVSLLGTSHFHADSAKIDNSLTQIEYLNTNNVMLVIEYMSNGSLHDLLHTNPSPPMLLTWSKRVQIAIQIAKALQFLHAGIRPKVIHRDVKSSNVLFDKDWNAKLADFGLALRLHDDRVDSLSQPAGTIGYLDPCYTTPCMLSTKNDVFSFGVLLLEIISGQKVIDATRNSISIVDWALDLIKLGKFEKIFDQRLVMPVFMQGMIKHLLNIAACCISIVQNDRPTMEDIVFSMEGLYIAREKYPIWIEFLRGIMTRKRGHKTTCKKRIVVSTTTTTTIRCVALIQHQQQNDETQKPKLLLKDILLKC